VRPDWALARVAEGARLAGRSFDEPQLGALERGAPADLAVLDYAPPAPLDETSFAGHWLSGLGARSVRDVMVAGEWVVRDRRLVRIDQDELAATAREEAANLWGRLDEIPAHTFTPEVVMA
jgi:cytosine/adenosine deaminase-related metal-dependent hydrolase